jgi:hypothetical protein
MRSKVRGFAGAYVDKDTIRGSLGYVDVCSPHHIAVIVITFFAK